MSNTDPSKALVVLNGAEEFEVNVKRFCLPGVELRRNCPGCGDLTVVDMGERYLSYPTANAVTSEKVQNALRSRS